MHRRGFSLIEVAVASAMAGIIAAAAVASFAALNRQLVRLQSESVASDNAKSMIDLLITDAQGIGGGPLRPWMALWVENGDSPSPRLTASQFNPYPDTHAVRPDRLTFATLKPNASSCPIVAMTDTTITSTGVGLNCCLVTLATDGGIDGTGGPLVLPALHLYAINGTKHRQVSIEAGAISPLTCRAEIGPGPLTFPGTASTSAADLVNGTMVASSIKTVYLDNRNTLNVFEDKRSFDGFNVDIGPLEAKRISGDIYDFQVQIGYDRELDGRVVDQMSNADEWLFNDPGDVNNFPIDAVRMLGLGVVVGVRLTDPDYSSSAQIIGSNAIVGQRIHLRGAMGKAALRNLFIFF